MPGPPAWLRVEVPPPGLVAELRDLRERQELNGARGVLLGQAPERRGSGRVGVRLDDGQVLSVSTAHVVPVAEVTEQLSEAKGVGVVARLPLRPGHLITRERPVLLGRLGEGVDREQFKALSSSQQEAVLSLADVHAGPEGHTLEGIMATNGLPRGRGPDEVVLCLLASRFNHSCRPNAEYLWLEAEQAEEVRAVQSIAPGEEVCVNYFGDAVRLPRELRQQQLREGFRFHCRCQACLSADPASDQRRSRLTQLSEDILACQDRPEEGIRMAEEILDLMQREGISAPRTTAQPCNDAFQLALLLGDAEQVREWAHLSFEAHRLGWGEDHPLTRQMRHYAQHPPLDALAAGAAPPRGGPGSAGAGGAPGGGAGGGEPAATARAARGAGPRLAGAGGGTDAGWLHSLD